MSVPSTSKNTFSILVFLFAVFLCGCEKKQEPQTSSPSVKFSILHAEPVTLTTELPGRVSSFMMSEVRPQVNGILQERLFEEGTDVVAGQVLYQVDPSLFEATYHDAEANLEKAEANELAARLLAERYSRLIKVHAISIQEYDDAVAAHRQAKAEIRSAKEHLKTARINLDYTQIKAPVSGRIGRSYVTPGALVTANQADPLCTIQQLDKVYVDVTQSNVEMLRLRRALANGDILSGGPDSAKVRLMLEDNTPYAYPGTGSEPTWLEGDLLFSDVTIDMSTGAVNIRARFDNPVGVLMPGMYVRALIEEGTLENALLVPQKSVMRDTRGRPYVYVLTQNTSVQQQDKSFDSNVGDEFIVESRQVAIARNIGNKWLVSSGLQAGERLMVEGHIKSRPGSVVSGLLVDSVMSASNASIVETTQLR